MNLRTQLLHVRMFVGTGSNPWPRCVVESTAYQLSSRTGRGANIVVLRVVLHSTFGHNETLGEAGCHSARPKACQRAPVLGPAVAGGQTGRAADLFLCGWDSINDINEPKWSFFQCA